MERTLQWAAAFGLLCQVASTICLILSEEMVGLRPRPRASSVQAVGPSWANRCRHKFTVGRLVFNSWAILRLALPAAAINTMGERNTTFWDALRAVIQASSVRRCCREIAGLEAHPTCKRMMHHFGWEYSYL
jgi:hypothetical protein